MPTNAKVALVLSLIPVGPRKGAGEIGQQYFALHLSASFENAPPSDAWKELVIPWLSAWDVEKCVVKRSGGGDLDGEMVRHGKRPGAHGGSLASLQKKVVADRESVWQPDNINKPSETDGSMTVRPTLVESLHTLSTYPGGIPFESRVIHYFQVKGSWTPAAGEYVVAAPVFNLMWNKVGVRCEPEAGFALGDWPKGWPYRLTPNVIDGVNVEMRAYVKPLLIKAATVDYVKYDDDPTYAGDGAPVGPNFKDYWFRSQGVHAWTEKLKDFVSGVADIGGRLREARGAFENVRGDMAAAWEDVQLMGLAFFGQWVEPKTGELVKASDGAELLKTIAEVLKFTANERQALQGGLDKLRADLRGGSRNERRDLWLGMFRRGFGDGDMTTQEILKRSQEKPQDFNLLLYYEWDYAVSRLDGSVEVNKHLKSKWASAFHDNRAEQEKFFFEGDTKRFGVKTVRKNFEDETFSFILNKPTFAETKVAIIRRLEALRRSFEDADYIPRLVSADDLGQENWDALWSVWAGNGGYLKRYVNLLADPPRTEGKPSGLTIQFDRLEQRQEQTAPKDNPTTWRKIGGVGVLVRDATDAAHEWHLASAATMGLRGVRVRSVDAVEGDLHTVVLLLEVSSDAPVEAYHLVIGETEYREVLAVEGATPAPSPDVELSPNQVRRGGPLQRVTVRGTKAFPAGDLNVKRIAFMRLLTDSALVPVRVPYRRGVRYPLLTYNQRSLISPAALADAVKDYFTATNQATVATDAIFDYGTARNGNSLFNLVPLKFGVKYQMAAFMVDTAGGLPGALSKGVPWALTDGQLRGLDLPEGVIVDFPYWRKVPVGQVRVSALAKGDLKPTTWPDVPDDVSPVAWESKPNKAVTSEAQHKKKSQLALLHDGSPDADTFSFGVKLPTIDIDTQERWLPKSKNPHLADVLTHYFKRLSLRGGPVSDNDFVLPDEDLAIDDPAVEKLLFVLERYDFDAPEMKWKVAGWKTWPVPQDENAAGIKRHQRDWVKVLCRRTEQAETDYEVREARPNMYAKEAGHEVAVVVPRHPVALARLRVFAMVPDKFVADEGGKGIEAKFDFGFFDMTDEADHEKEKVFVEDFDSPESAYDLSTLDPAKQKAFFEERAGFKCLKPHSILIETPNNELPAPTSLWQHLSLELTGSGRDVVAVSLRKGDADMRARQRNIIKCELLRQQWRWQGYPVSHEGVRDLMLKWIPPAGGASTDGPVTQDHDENFLVWEVKSFADMDDAFDTLTITLPYTHESPELIYEDSFARDLLARYVRYGLRVHSRYEPLFRRTREKAAPVTSTQPHAIYGEARNLTGVGWRRALVRYRGPRPLKPVVQAIVPLTLSDEKEGGAAPFMLVLDETMFAQCGITEWIECEIVKVALPDADKSDNRDKIDCGGTLVTRKLLHQAGYDPLITADNAACAMPSADDVTLRPLLVGPFGHTKDTGARQPLLASSSFLVEPRDEAAGWRAHSWDFAKVRFRRLSGDDLLDNDAGEGDWTEPTWVQFLPSSGFDLSRKRGEAIDLVAEWDVGAKAIRLGTSSVEVNPFPAMKKFSMFKYCLLLTFQVKDFRGKGKYEVYHDCVKLDFAADDKSLYGAYDRAADPQSAAVLTARLVEVQSVPARPRGGAEPYEYEDLPQVGANEDFGQKFWAALFDRPDVGTAPNAKYRITRISPPVSVAKF